MHFPATDELPQTADGDKMLLDGLSVNYHNHNHSTNHIQNNNISNSLNRTKSLSHYSIDSEEGLDQFLSSQLFDFDLPHEYVFPNGGSSNAKNPISHNNSTNNIPFGTNNNFIQTSNQMSSQHTSSSTHNDWPQNFYNHKSSNTNHDNFDIFRTPSFFQPPFQSAQPQFTPSTFNGPMHSPLFPCQQSSLPHPQQSTTEPLPVPPPLSLTQQKEQSTLVPESQSVINEFNNSASNQDKVAIVKKRRLDSSPVAISTTISWIDASSLQGDEDDEDDGNFLDDQDDGELSSSSEALHNSKHNNMIKGSNTSDISVIPEDMMTRARTRRGKIPRLVKHDIRRYYGRMLYNVMNSHDRHLILRWFQTFAVQSMKLLRLEALGPMVYAEANQQEAQLITGRNSAVSYLLEVQRKIPDLVTRLNDHYQVLRWKERRSSQIVFQATYTGTSFEYVPDSRNSHTADQIQSLDDTESIASSHNNTTTVSGMSSVITPSTASNFLTAEELSTQVLCSLPDEFDHHAPSPIPNWSSVPTGKIEYTSNNNIVAFATPPIRKISHLVQFNMTIETTLHLNDEMLLYRWESKTLNFQTKRIPYSEI